MVVQLSYDKILKMVVFPIFALRSEDYWVRDGLLFIDNLVVDDKNQSGTSIGIRRLHTPHKLYPITRTCFSFMQLIKSTPRAAYIDSKGAIFSYEKTQFMSVKSIRIKKTILKDTHTVVILRGINFRIATERPPLGKEWAQILYRDNSPWMLYSFSEKDLGTLKRKI